MLKRALERIDIEVITISKKALQKRKGKEIYGKAMNKMEGSSSGGYVGQGIRLDTDGGGHQKWMRLCQITRRDETIKR